MSTAGPDIDAVQTAAARLEDVAEDTAVSQHYSPHPHRAAMRQHHINYRSMGNLLRGQSSRFFQAAATAAGLTSAQHSQTDLDVQAMITPLQADIGRGAPATVKLEQMSRNSILLSVATLYFSSLLCLAAAIILAAIISRESASLGMVTLSLLIEGISRTLAVAVVAFLSIFFPTRVARFHARANLPLQHEQILLILFTWALMATPVMSVYGPVVFWRQYAQALVHGPRLFANNTHNFTLAESVYISFSTPPPTTSSDLEYAFSFELTTICTQLTLAFAILYFGLTGHYFGITSPWSSSSTSLTSFSVLPEGNSGGGANKRALLPRECFFSLGRALRRVHRGLFFATLAFAGICIALATLCRILPSQVPLVGIISVIKACLIKDLCHPNEYGGVGFQRALVVTAQFILECLCVYYTRQVSNRTRAQLKRIPYEAARGKHLGFKFFTSNKHMMYFFALVCGAIVTACSGTVVGNYDWDETLATSKTDPLKQVGITFYSVGFGSFYLLLASFLFSFAYAYLPPDSRDGLGGFLFGGKKRTSANDARPVYAAKLSDVSVIRKHRIKLLDAEGADRRNQLRQQRSLLPNWRGSFQMFIPQTLVDMAKALTGEEDEDENAHLPLERRLAHVNDACYQINANIFCLETEVLLFNLAYAAYYNEEEVRRALPARFRFIEMIQHKGTDMQCYVVCDDAKSEIIVCFRGTVTATNVLQDVNYFTTPAPIRAEDVEPLYDHTDFFQRARAWEKPTVHRGFFNAYSSVRDRMRDCVSNLIDSSPNGGISLYATGHSLGGALAMLLAVDIAYKYKTPGSKLEGVQLTTFGSPRVGNFAFNARAARLIPTIHRFCLGGDPATNLPVSRNFNSVTYLGYLHVGTEILMDLDKINLLINPLFIEKQITHYWGGIIPVNHLMNSYALALMYWNARVHPEFVPDWWLPVINELLECEMDKIEAAKKTHGGLFASNIDAQLQKEGAIFWMTEDTARLKRFSIKKKRKSRVPMQPLNANGDVETPQVWGE